ncbi:MAG: hypothetical protein WBD59_10385 [Candidatus Sulfotelmatobacter sp.]
MANKQVKRENQREAKEREKQKVRPGESRERNHLQELLPPGREPIHQGQQFDELQRQHKDPDNTVRPQGPRVDHS